MKIAIVDGYRRHAIEDEDYKHELADEWPAARNQMGQGMTVAVKNGTRVAYSWLTTADYAVLRGIQRAKDRLIGTLKEELQDG